MALPNIINEINTIKSTYLPLSGGSLTGTLVSTTNQFSRGSSTNHMFEVYSGTSYKTGGYISLFGETYSTKPGGFELIASSTDTGQKRLTGLTDGSLTWNGYNVLTSAGGEVKSQIYTTGNIPYELRHPTAANGDTTRDTATYQMLCVGLDKTGKRGGGVEVCYNTDGSRALQFTQRNRADSGYNSLALREFADGTVYAQVNSQRIVTLSGLSKSTSTWYRKYSDGWIEQGGIFAGGSASNSKTITFPIAFTTMNTIQSTIITTRGTASYDGEIFVRSKSLTSFVAGSRLNDVSYYMWYACGY